MCPTSFPIASSGSLLDTLDQLCATGISTHSDLVFPLAFRILIGCGSRITETLQIEDAAAGVADPVFHHTLGARRRERDSGPRTLRAASLAAGIQGIADQVEQAAVYAFRFHVHRGSVRIGVDGQRDAEAFRLGRINRNTASSGELGSVG